MQKLPKFIPCQYFYLCITLLLSIKQKFNMHIHAHTHVYTYCTIVLLRSMCVTIHRESTLHDLQSVGEEERSRMVSAMVSISFIVSEIRFINRPCKISKQAQNY